MGRDQGPFRAAFCLRGPCGWGGLSPTPCLQPCACRCATVRGGDRTPSATLTTQHGGVLLGPDQADLPLSAGESEAGTGRRLEVRCGWQQPRWERKVSLGGGGGRDKNEPLPETP